MTRALLLWMLLTLTLLSAAPRLQAQPFTLSPTADLRIGSRVTITLQAGAGLQFNAGTSAHWSGRFEPLVGDPSNTFDIAIAASELQESSPAVATIVIGKGTFARIPQILTLAGPGVLRGTLTIRNSNGSTTTAQADLTVSADTLTWRSVGYPTGTGPGSVPVLTDTPIESLPLMQTSAFPDPSLPPTESLTAATSSHLCLALEVEENSSSTFADAPATIKIDLVPLDALGNEISGDRVRGVVLAKLPDDGILSTPIRYSSDLARPVIVVDQLPLQSAYPQFLFVRAPANGSVIAVPSLD